MKKEGGRENDVDDDDKQDLIQIRTNKRTRINKLKSLTHIKLNLDQSRNTDEIAQKYARSKSAAKAVCRPAKNKSQDSQSKHTHRQRR